MSFLVRPIRVACAIIGLACAAGALAADLYDLQREPQGAASATVRQVHKTGQYPALLSPIERVRDEARDQPEAARRFFLDKRLAPEMTEYPTQQMLQAYQESLALPLHSTVGGGIISASGLNGPDAVEQLFWGELGPGNIGGRTRVLRFLSFNGVNMVTAGVAGGVWTTANSGASWTATGDLMANLAVNSLAVDPFSASVMLAGTGEGYFNFEALINAGYINGDAITGAGIFKTTNGGANWTQLASTANSNFSFVNDLVYKPGSSSIVYAATGTGLWRSLDAGTSWTQILGAASAHGCTQVVYRSDADTAVASCGYRAPTDAATGIWVSTNASAASPTWTHIVGGIGSGAPDIVSLMGRISLAIAPSNQSIMYALVSCNGSPAEMCGGNDYFNEFPNGVFHNALRVVLQSTSGGSTWTIQYQNNLLYTSGSLSNGALLLSDAHEARKFECLGFGYQDVILSQGQFNNVIAVDPVDPTKVWVGGVDLFRSDDSGATWGVASYGWKAANDANYVHAAQQGIFFEPGYNGTTNQNMYVTNGGGIFKTTNARAAVGTSTSNDGNNSVCGTVGLPAVTWSNLNNDYGVTQFYNGSVYPSGTQYFGGTQDNGVVRGTDGSPNGWTALPVTLSSDGGYTAIDRTTSGSSTVLYTENSYISIQKSLNNGASFFCATNGIVDCTTHEGHDVGQFINPFTIDPNNFQNLWTSGQFLWRTTDAAVSWTRASANLLDNGSNCGNRPEQFSAERVSFGDSTLVVAGTDCGNVFRSASALSATSSTSWQSSKPRFGYIADIAFDPSSKENVYAVYSTFGGTHVWKSTNGGQTFVGIDGTGSVLPDVPVTAVAVSPFNGNTIYIGTDIGVFVTNDGGANWARENTGFANAPTESLVFNASGPTGQEIYAFTHGRGVFRAPVSNLASSTTGLGSSPNSSTYGQSVTLTATLGGGSGTPTGTVDFLDGATTIASGVAIVSGVATTNTTALTVGTHSLSAVYSGNGTYSISIGVHTQTVNAASTTTALNGDTPDPSSVGENVTVFGSVAVVAPGAGAPTGAIQVTSANSSGCTITLPATSCILTFTTMGAKTINGAYAGDGNFSISLTAIGRAHSVDPTDTTTTITSDNPDPSAIGQQVTVSVAVVATPGTGSPASGTITVTGSNTTGCSFSRPNTSCNLSFTATGAQTLNASYGGNADYNASSTLSPTAHTVVGTATTTTITVDSPDPSVVGQPVAVTATVSSAGATGTITVTGTNTTGCTIALPSTSCNATFTAAGAQTLSASYGGDASFASSSTASPTAHTVNKAATTLSIVAAPDPAADVNALITITATLAVTAPGAGAPTGTIAVSGPQFQGCTITPPATFCVASFTAGGTQALNASYPGDANFAISNAPQILHNDEIFKDGFQ